MRGWDLPGCARNGDCLLRGLRPEAPLDGLSGGVVFAHGLLAPASDWGDELAGIGLVEFDPRLDDLDITDDGQ